MKETEAIIERIKRINAEYVRIELAVDESLYDIRPGETLLARLHDRWDPYLRMHWWPVGISGNNKLIIERPAVESYEPGQIVSLLGAVGKPYRFRRSLRNVLLMAYDTPPIPLLMMIHWLLANRVNVTMALLGTARDYNPSHLPPEVEIIQADESLTWPDQVLTLGWADQVFVVVAQDNELERFAQIMAFMREKRTDINKNYLFGVFQSILPCGIGACDACLLKITGNLVHVCMEGPAFDLTLVKLPS